MGIFRQLGDGMARMPSYLFHYGAETPAFLERRVQSLWLSGENHRILTSFRLHKGETSFNLEHTLQIPIKEMILKSVEFHLKTVVINADRQHVCHTKIKEKLQGKSPMPVFIPLEICSNVKYQHFKNKKQTFF